MNDAHKLTKEEHAAMLMDARKVLSAALDLILLSAPVMSLQIGTVLVANDPATGKVQMIGNVPVDGLVALMGHALMEAQKLAASQPPKLVLPPGAIDPRRN